MAEPREIKEGLQRQGEDEQIAYRLDTTNYSADTSSPGTPSSVSAKIYSDNLDGTYTDVTSTKMSGSASVSTVYITLPSVISLTAGTLYRVEVKFTLEGNIREVFAQIQAER